MNWFSLFLALGAGLGLYQVYRTSPPWIAGRRMDAGMLVLLASLLGARIGYVLRYPVGGITGFLRFWDGGLSLEGALIGGGLAFLVASPWMGIPIGRLADSLSVMALPLWVAGWLGCWQAGCGCGALAQGNPLWALPVMDETGLVAYRFPLQLFAAVVGLFTFLLVERLPRPMTRAGVVGSRVGLALGLNLLADSMLLEESRFSWAGLHPLTWTAVLIAIFSLVGWMAAHHRFSIIFSDWLEHRKRNAQG